MVFPDAERLTIFPGWPIRKAKYYNSFHGKFGNQSIVIHQLETALENPPWKKYG